MSTDVVTDYLDDLDVNILVTQQPYSKENHSKVLDQLYIAGRSAKKVSEQHRLILIHLNLFNADMYKEVLDMVASHLYYLLRLNTVPVILHQETRENVLLYQKNSLIPQAKHLLFIKVDDNLLQSFELLTLIKKEQGMLNGIQGILKKDQKKQKEEFIKQKIFGMVFVDDEKITQRVLFEPGTHIDFCGMYFQDLDVKKCKGTSSDKVFFQSILKIFPTLPPHHLNTIVRHMLREFEELKRKEKEEKEQKEKEEMDRLNGVKKTDNISGLRKFEKCMRKDRRRFYFKKFATKESSVEPSYLYEEVLQYKGVHSLDYKLKKAQRIYKIFVDPKGILPVNTNMKHIREVQEIIEKAVKFNEFPPDDLFDRLLSDVKSVLSDSFLRFVLLDVYKDMEREDEEGNFVMNYKITFNAKRSNEIITVTNNAKKTGFFDSGSESIELEEIKLN